MMIVKDIVKGKAAIALILVFILLCLASVILVRGQPESIEKDIEIDCKWKGAPVSANLKWTEPKEDPAKTTITNTDSGSKTSKSDTIQASGINTQQALMLTGASAGAALAGGGLLVKKKLEGSSSSEQEAKQATSTSTVTKELLTQKQMDSQSSSQQSQPPTQTQQSSIQNPPKDGGLTTTASTLTGTASTVTKDLLMQKQMESLSTPAGNSTSAQGVGDHQSEQAASQSTSKSLGLMASSSSSAAQIATEMWPQRQKEFEQLAKQRAELAAKFSIPSYSTGSIPSLPNATGNAWAKLQGFGSAISNGISNAWATIKPYAPAILLIGIIVTAVYGGFVFGLFGAGMTGAGMASAGVAGAAGTGISLGGGAGLVGAGIAVGLGAYTAYNLGIINYPQQSSFTAEHTQIIDQQKTVEIKDEKGSGHYGEDVAQEQLEQAEIGKDSIIEITYQGKIDHREAQDRCAEWLEEHGVTDYTEQKFQKGWDRESGYSFKCRPDFVSDEYILEAKTGMETEFKTELYQAENYMQLAEQQNKRLVYIFRHPPEEDWWNYIIDMLVEELGENFIVEYMGG